MSYIGMLFEKHLEVQRQIRILEVTIKEKLVEFAEHMRNYPVGFIPKWLDTLGGVALPRALLTLQQKRNFHGHLTHMIRYDGCLWQGWCILFGLPECAACEGRAPFYPVGYTDPYFVNSSNSSSSETPHQG